MRHHQHPRICIVTTSFPRWPEDDQGTFVLEVSKALHRQGVLVRVIAPHAPGAKDREDIEGIDVVRPRYAWPERFEALRKYRAGLPVILRKEPIVWLLLPLFLLSQFLTLLRHARDCDVIHANWTLSASAAVAAKIFLRKPVIVTVQGSDIYETQRLGWLKSITKAILSRCDQVLALSSSLAQVTASLGVSPERILVLPNGVDVEYFRPIDEQREPIILFVGSLIERKGVRTLVEAGPAIFASHPEYSIVFVGEGPLSGELVELSRKLNIEDKVLLTGSQSPAEVRQWMQKSKLLVLPSVEEGLGVVLLEALACGTPCVASKVGGIPDIITPEIGRLIDPADLEQLAEAVHEVIDDPELWARMSQAARERILDHFSWQQISSRLLKIYAAIAAESDPGN